MSESRAVGSEVPGSEVGGSGAAGQRLAADVGRLSVGFQEARAEELARLGAEVAEAVQPVLAAAREAMEATHPGLTGAGAPLADRALAGWDDSAWTDCSASAAPFGVGGLVRIGCIESLQVPGGPLYRIPALVPLLCQGNLVLAGSGAALDRANDTLQSVVFRLLAAVPPGKLRITAIDAVGLGSTFSALLQLNEAVRGPKVWHEEREVAEALVELSAHMSMVIQKYLKNEFASIDDYNRIAGEVAEPYRLLVVGSFPAGFRPETAERLLSIAKNGPPLGVHVLLTLDTTVTPPSGFGFVDLERHATVLRYQAGRWEWREAPRGRAEIELDDRPPPAVVEGLIAQLDPLIQRADDVRVAFAPLCDPEPWTASSAEGLEAPLGRRGARELLWLRLGQAGTAHHALIGGRTGSGKTALLHALIASLAWRYAPDELELYLVDFKEGVEFQVYRELPHARVVAIQSEREFGVSVLEGLRAELNRRGDLFRARGIDDLRSWRRTTGERLPRIVLVIDEFQVFFELNDTLSHHARALLSDLTSRGRGFGIHAVLASQTLSNMDLDARALSQIGVRVALQMGEADSYKVLGKDNDAARFLQRPGEAIFNEAGGLPGYNVRFQTAFLSREEREERTALLRDRARAAGTGRRPVLFDGNRPAELAENVAFLAMQAASVTQIPRGYDVFLGEPTALQEGHTAVRMRRQARGNLLLVGNDEPTAFYTMLTAVASIVMQVPAGQGRVRVLNLTNVDDPLHDLFGLYERLPVPTEVQRAARVEAVLTDAVEALKRRREAAAASTRSAPLPPPEFVVIFGLQRARGFDKQGLKVPMATTCLSQLVTEGPDLGIHVLIWVDTPANLARVLSNAEVAEFGGRVALVGGDALRILGASVPPGLTLRRGSALLATEDDAERLQKFRCYGPRSAAWLDDTLPRTE